MGWRCRRMRTQLTLLVGDDLPEREHHAVESHVAGCDACRDYLRALERSRNILREGSGVHDEAVSPSSLWPALRCRLAAAPMRQRPSWFPVGALAAASVAIAIVMWNRTAAVLPNARWSELDNSSWLPPVIRVVETTNDDALTDSWFAPEPSTNRTSPPVRSLFLLESGSPSAVWEEEL